MADLDDFFAKKDRKKSKAKKFTTPDDIMKSLDEKKVDKQKKEVKIVSGGEENSTKPQEDEEWKEFEEEKKDYSGLKIQNLSLADTETSDTTESETVDGELEENEQGEFIPRKKGPWKAIEVDNTPEQVKEEKPVEKAEPPKRSSNAYIPPHMQRQSSMLATSRTPRSKNAAPDISSTEFFPSLSAASNETPISWARKKHEPAFEEVRNSKSHSNRDVARGTQSLEIGNKFGALESEHS